MRAHDSNACGCPLLGPIGLRRLVSIVCASPDWPGPPPRVETDRRGSTFGGMSKRSLIRLADDAPACVVAHELAHCLTAATDWPDTHGPAWESTYARLLVTTLDAVRN